MDGLSALQGNPWVLDLGWTLLHFLWQGAAWTVAAIVGLRVLAGRSAAVRYRMALLLFFLMAVSPCATLVWLHSANAVNRAPAVATTTDIRNDTTARDSFADTGAVIETSAVVVAVTPSEAGEASHHPAPQPATSSASRNETNEGSRQSSAWLPGIVWPFRSRNLRRRWP